MARRSAPFDDLIDSFAKYPWWLGVIGALLIYFNIELVAGDALLRMVRQARASLAAPAIKASPGEPPPPMVSAELSSTKPAQA